MPMSDAPDAKRTPNWPQIEADYRAGIKPLRLIAEENGISHPAIRKRAKRDDWTRNLNEKIHAKAEVIVQKFGMASFGSRGASGSQNGGSQEMTLGTEKAIVAANAGLIAQVRLKHRGFIDRALKLTEVMFGDLECLSSPEGQGLIEVLMDAVNTPEKDESPEDKKRRQAKQRVALERAFGLDTRVDTGKRLADTLVNLITAERTAYGITDKTADETLGQGKVLNEAERASRLAALLSLALKRKAEAQLTETPTVSDAS